MSAQAERWALNVKYTSKFRQWPEIWIPLTTLFCYAHVTPSSPRCTSMPKPKYCPNQPTVTIKILMRNRQSTIQSSEDLVEEVFNTWTDIWKSGSRTCWELVDLGFYFLQPQVCINSCLHKINLRSLPHQSVSESPCGIGAICHTCLAAARREMSHVLRLQDSLVCRLVKRSSHLLYHLAPFCILL